MSEIGVETTQHVNINYKVAGVGERILAYLVDIVVLAVYYLALFTIVEYSSNFTDITPIEDAEGAMWIGILVIILPIMLYHLLSEIFWNGYTVGKWFIGIRVVKIDGTRPSIGDYFIRWLIRLVEITLTSGVVAFFTIIINGKGQRVGDIAAKTCVIKVRRSVRLDDTIFANMNGDYDPVFPQVTELSDEDVRIIKDILKSKRDYDESAWKPVLFQTRELIEEKLGTADRTMTDIQFLNQVLKDFNAVVGSQG